MATALWDEGDWDETDWGPDADPDCQTKLWDEGDWDEFCWADENTPADTATVAYGPGWGLEWGEEDPRTILARKRKDEIADMVRRAFSRATAGAPEPVQAKAVAIVSAPTAGDAPDFAAVARRSDRQVLALMRRLEALERAADDDEAAVLVLLS